MNLEELKKVNKSDEIIFAEETLLKPYIPTIMAIPKEHWKAIITILIEQGKNSIIIQNNIESLPKWSNINDSLMPNLNKMLKIQSSVLSENQRDITTFLKHMDKKIERDINVNVQNLIRVQTSEMDNWANEIIFKLQARDLSPIKLRLTWIVIGVLITFVFLGILALFKVI